MSSSILLGKYFKAISCHRFSRYEQRSNGVKPVTIAASGLLPLLATVVPLNQNKPSTWKGARTYTNIEFNEKRANAICFWCNEKYEPRHNCLKKQIYLMEIEEIAKEGEGCEKEEAYKIEA